MAVRLAALPFACLSATAGALVSQRGLRLSLLAVIAVPAFSGWLRPPLSADIRAFELPLLPTASSNADQLLDGPRRAHLLSAGSVLALALTLGAVVAAACPRRFSWAAALCLCALTVSAAAAALNHPELIERLDGELEQRSQLVSVLERTVEPSLDITSAPRVRRSHGAAARGSWRRGALYLKNDRSVLWLLAAGGVLFGARGRLHRRLACLLWACVASVILAGLVTGRRLEGEWQWMQAVRAERRAQIGSARGHARSALAVFPAFKRLDRTWLLLGKLDELQARASRARRYFRARQLLRSGARRQAIAELESLHVGGAGAHADDHRTAVGNEACPGSRWSQAAPSTRIPAAALAPGPAAGPAGLAAAPARAAAGLIPIPPLTPGLTPTAVAGPAALTPAAGLAPAPAPTAARGMAPGPGPAVGLAALAPGPALIRRALADAAAAKGFALFRQGHPESAAGWWRRACAVDRSARFRPLLVAAARAGPHCREPESIAAVVDPLLHDVADRALRASLLAMTGDAYFAAGRFVEARRRYERSLASFALPKSINYRAMRGLLGM